MAETTFVTNDPIPVRTAMGFPGRIQRAIEAAFAGLGEAVAEGRRELRIEQAKRGFSFEQLRDLGLDRGAC
ncbi:MAG: hypothetical protein OEM59_02280 [Rhodospirillales bacterium]|nr:hypothetical protein [Rhodospirillales bacterium]